MTSDYGLPFLLGPAPDMLRAMKNEEVHRPRIAIVGAGKLGAALAISLRGAGYSISEVVSRDREGSRRKAKALARRVGTGTATFQTSALRAELVWFCVPDGEIERCARLLAARDWEGKIAVHSSGAMTSDELRVLRNRGARVASVHPMMTFVEEVTPALKGVGFAIEGDREAVQTISKIVRRLGGESFPIAAKDKALYHAWGTFLSPLLTALLAAGEQVAQGAAVPANRSRRWMLPIVRQTVENYAKQGRARGFSGPIIRGDAATIRKHLEVLRRLPLAREVYVALARSALRTLPTRHAKELKALLGQS
jgi:predicted short-subunit dehydrogenase-like oxidoreductase (DUF2520 family)